MKYRCIKEFKVNDKIVANEGDIVVLGIEGQLYNITTTIDHRNISLGEALPYLENILDEYTYDSSITEQTLEPVNIENTANIEAFENIVNELLETYKKKNSDYGDSFTQSLDEWGLQAAAVRMDDKMNRFKNFVQNGTFKVKDEAVMDTLKDLANYAIMTVLYLQK